MLAKVDKKFKKLKQKVKPRGAKSVLSDPDVKTFGTTISLVCCRHYWQSI